MILKRSLDCFFLLPVRSLQQNTNQNTRTNPRWGVLVGSRKVETFWKSTKFSWLAEEHSLSQNCEWGFENPKILCSPNFDSLAKGPAESALFFWKLQVMKLARFMIRVRFIRIRLIERHKATSLRTRFDCLFLSEKLTMPVALSTRKVSQSSSKRLRDSDCKRRLFAKFGHQTENFPSTDDG